MKMYDQRPDLLQVALIVNIIAIVIALLTAGIIAWTNAGSRSLVLAVGAFGGAAFLFLIQLPFELQRSTVRDRISTAITIDRAKPEIRQWIYPVEPGVLPARMAIETGASEWLAGTKPSAFKGDRDRLTEDFTLFSLVGFFSSVEFDWPAQGRNLQRQGHWQRND